MRKIIFTIIGLISFAASGQVKVLDSVQTDKWTIKDYTSPNMVFETIIPRNVRLSESPSFGLPVISFDVDGKGTIAYLNLAGEIVQRNGLQKATN
jgi:cellulose biosynthesis protein BcsQ